VAAALLVLTLEWFDVGLTTLLAAARQGDEQAAGQAFALLYDDLRRLSRSRLRQHQTLALLDTTAPVHVS
jgi:hypothetical protein